MAPCHSLHIVQTTAWPFLLSPLQLPHAFFCWTSVSSLKGSCFLTFLFFFSLHLTWNTHPPTPSLPRPLTLTHPSGFRKPFLTHVRGLVYCCVFHNDVKYFLHLLINESLVIHVYKIFAHCSISSAEHST